MLVAGIAVLGRHDDGIWFGVLLTLPGTFGLACVAPWLQRWLQAGPRRALIIGSLALGAGLALLEVLRRQSGQGLLVLVGLAVAVVLWAEAGLVVTAGASLLERCAADWLGTTTSRMRRVLAIGAASLLLQLAVAHVVSDFPWRAFRHLSVLSPALFAIAWISLPLEGAKALPEES